MLSKVMAKPKWGTLRTMVMLQVDCGTLWHKDLGTLQNEMVGANSI